MKLDEARDMVLAMSMVTDVEVIRKLYRDTVIAVKDTVIDRLIALGLSNDDGDIGNLSWWDKGNHQVILPEEKSAHVDGHVGSSRVERDEDDPGIYYVYWNGSLDRSYRIASEEEALLMRIANTTHTAWACLEDA